MTTPVNKFHYAFFANAVQNLAVEGLAVDPVVTSAFRLFGNTTSGDLKYSYQGSEGQVVVDALIGRTELTTVTTDLQSQITTNNDTLTTAISNEVSARTTAVAGEATARIAGDATVASNAASATATAASNASDALATETTARLAGDADQAAATATLQSEVNATQAGAGLSTAGAYIPLTGTGYLDAATSVANATALLDAGLVQEVSDRTAAVAAEASARANAIQVLTDADTNLQTQLTNYIDGVLAGNTAADNAETAARISGDAGLQTELDATQAAIGLATDGSFTPITSSNYMNAASTVYGAAFALDAQLKTVTDGLASEVSSRTTAITTVTASIQTEQTRATTKENALQSELDTTQAGAGLATDGTYPQPTGTNYLNASTTLLDASVVLDSALKTVADRVSTIETTSIPGLSTDLANEITRATNAETAEASARATAISSAVSTINTSISNEVTARTNADSNLQSQIDTLTAAAGEGAAALRTALNAGRVIWRSVDHGGPAMVHTATHGFDSDEFTFSILVKDTDNVYRTSEMPVEVNDSNSINIYLSASADIKVNFSSTAQLA